MLLVALVCWAFPIQTLAETAEPQKPKVETNNDYTSDDIIIKDNVLQPTQPNAANPRPKSVGTVSRSGVVSAQTGEHSGRDYSKAEVEQLIRDYSAQYGISADLPLRIANCESGFNQFSKNKTSTASGVFQYLGSTWSHTELGKQNLTVFDADANVHMAIKSIASGGISNWAASAHCWNH